MVTEREIPFCETKQMPCPLARFVLAVMKKPGSFELNDVLSLPNDALLACDDCADSVWSQPARDMRAIMGSGVISSIVDQVEND